MDSIPRLQYITPSPILSAEDVIKIQLDALQLNDLVEDNAGISVVFNFASPINRASIGSLKRFIQLLKAPIYHTILGFQEALLDELILQDTIARQKVSVVHQHIERSFTFILSLQMDEPYQNCWMTDTVLPL